MTTCHVPLGYRREAFRIESGMFQVGMTNIVLSRRIAEHCRILETLACKLPAIKEHACDQQEDGSDGLRSDINEQDPLGSNRGRFCQFAFQFAHDPARRSRDSAARSFLTPNKILVSHSTPRIVARRSFSFCCDRPDRSDAKKFIVTDDLAVQVANGELSYYFYNTFLTWERKRRLTY